MAAGRRTTNKDALGLFLEELRAACELAGIGKSDELADMLGYSASLVRMVMSGHRIPSLPLPRDVTTCSAPPGRSAG